MSSPTSDIFATPLATTPTNSHYYHFFSHYCFIYPPVSSLPLWLFLLLQPTARPTAPPPTITTSSPIDVVVLDKGRGMLKRT